MKSVKNVVLRSAKNSYDFFSERLVEKIVRMQASGDLNITRDQARTLTNLVKAVAQECWNKSSKDVEKTLDKAVEEVKKHSDPFRDGE